MVEDRMFPMLDGPAIPWRLAEILYEAYGKLFGYNQSLEQIADRGGFGWGEVVEMGKMFKAKCGYGAYNAWIHSRL